MINCKACVDFLMDYLEGTLPDEQREVFEAHLNRCPPSQSQSYLYTTQ